ncbi:MAG: hypothetical protein ACR2H1_01280, partial [Limisphaerales bacterium]
FFFKTKLILSILIAGGLQAGWATDQIYINDGLVTVPPQIDAFSFLNRGTFDISTSLPFDTSSTLNFTNIGSMFGSVGFRFDTAPAISGSRRRAVNFVNEGVIEASDSFFGFTGNFATLSYLLVNSTNITSPGNLSTGPNGLLQLSGNNINLQNGGLLTGNSVTAQNRFTQLDAIRNTNFFNDNFINDLYWGVGTNGVLTGTGAPLALDRMPSQFDPNFLTFGSGSHEVVENRNGFIFTNTTRVPSFATVNFDTNTGTLNFSNYRAFANVTQAGVSNKVIQVVFVSTNAFDTNINVDVLFSPNSGSPAKGLQAIVQFTVADIDVVSGFPLTNFVYFGDNSAAAAYNTNGLFYQDNRNTLTFRPNSYDITTATPIEWNNGQPGNTPFDPALLYTTNYTNAQVDYVYAAYSAGIGPGNSPTNVLGDINDPTNSLGRLEILGGQVDLNGARMRSQGLLTIKSDNFVPLTQPARIDAQQINIDLRSPSQVFVISNLLSASVKRLGGQLNAWSAVWTNQTLLGDSNDRFHVLILENLLTSTQPTTAYGFIIRATNQPNGSIILADSVTVNRNLILDAENVTIAGNLTIPGDLGSTNLPRVINFTNLGFINIPGVGRFTKVSGPYATFVNRSNIVAAALIIDTAKFDNSGLLQTTVGSLIISNLTGVSCITNGQLIAATDINLQTADLRVKNSVMKAGSISTNNGIPTFVNGSILLTVGNRLTDGGSNNWEVINGVQLRRTSPGSWIGDLLGTRIQSSVRPFGNVQHIWSGDDRGATVAGFANNAALGRLVLDGFNSSKFRFSASSPGVTNALYVNFLEFKNGATNLTTSLSIDPNFIIYFASANLPPAQLNGMHTNRLRWVPSFGGPGTTNVVLRDGRTIIVSIALLSSSPIDSDGDGIPNALDAFPFDGPRLTATLTNLPPLTMQISWPAAAATTYTVEYKTNLLSLPWLVLTNLTSGPINAIVRVRDPVVPGSPRFYRVTYVP